MFIGFNSFMSDHGPDNASQFYANTESVGTLETNCLPHDAPAGGNKKIHVLFQ
jgi:hypothetical protein